MEIHDAAHRHDVTEEDMLHAVEHSLVVLISGEGDEIIIHAMPMRTKYRRLLER